MTTKPASRSLTIWGATLTAVLGLLAAFGVEIGPDEIAEVTTALGIIIGFALTLYGRIRARVPVSWNGGGNAPALLVACVLGAALTLTPGCAHLDNETQEVAKEVAVEAGKIAATYLINLGLSQLGDSAHELRPLTQQLQAMVTLAPANTPPTELATMLEAALTHTDPTTREQVMLTILESIAPPSATASPAAPNPVTDYLHTLATALRDPRA